MFKNYKTIIITAVCSVTLTLGCEMLVLGANWKSIIKINDIMKILDSKFYFDYDKEKGTDYAITGMTIAADDPYTNYYDKEKFNVYLTDSQNSYMGIGVVMGADENNEYLKIYSVMSDSPGEKAGLLKDDLILEINGKKLSADDLQLAADTIRECKSSVMMKIQRNGEIIDKEIIKASIEKHTVTSEILNNNIGYIKIASFDRRDEKDKNSQDTYDEFKKEADKLNEEGYKNLIIDLRDNPGGDVKVVSCIADYLLPKGVITYMEDKKGRKEYHYSDENYVDFNIVLLVNQNSASASELLAGALKDYNKAAIVGTKTYGKGIVQNVYSFGDGSGLSVTTARYFTPNGTCIHKIGIEPDYYVQQDADKSEDLQLDKAIELFSK